MIEIISTTGETFSTCRSHLLADLSRLASESCRLSLDDIIRHAVFIGDQWDKAYAHRVEPRCETETTPPTEDFAEHFRISPTREFSVDELVLRFGDSENCLVLRRCHNSAGTEIKLYGQRALSDFQAAFGNNVLDAWLAGYEAATRLSQRVALARVSRHNMAIEVTAVGQIEAEIQTLQRRLDRIITENTPRKPRKKPIGYVYFVLDPSRRRIKIGYSKKPEDRLTKMRTWCPDGKILGYVPGTISNERYAHKLWKHTHVELEWFDATPDLLRWCQECIDKNELILNPDDIALEPRRERRQLSAVAN